jgi:hypothetical protein
MKRFSRPSEELPPYSAAALQLVADGFTPELAALHLDVEPALFEDVLETARRHLSFTTLEQTVAMALSRGMIV